jgi:hypothetical protein
MGYISAMLMTYTTPEDCFCMMNCLFNRSEYQLKPMFLNGMPGLECCFYILLRLQKKYMRKLYDHMR